MGKLSRPLIKTQGVYVGPEGAWRHNSGRGQSVAGGQETPWLSRSDSLCLPGSLLFSRERGWGLELGFRLCFCQWKMTVCTARSKLIHLGRVEKASPVSIILELLWCRGRYCWRQYLHFHTTEHQQSCTASGTFFFSLAQKHGLSHSSAISCPQFIRWKICWSRFQVA